MTDVKEPNFQTRPTRHVGELEEIFPGVFRIWGGVKAMGLMEFPRNMVVLRDGDALTVVHGFRLPDPLRTQVEALGEIKHIIRLGHFHGMDDAYYVARYGGTLWAPPGVKHKDGLVPDVELTPHTKLPIEGLRVFSFERSHFAELALILDREGGILFTCDAIQNWEDYAGCNFVFRTFMPLMGFRGPTVIGPAWRKACEPADGRGLQPDFERLLEEDFVHLIAAHGRPLKHHAKDRIRERVTEIYGSQ